MQDPIVLAGDGEGVLLAAGAGLLGGAPRAIVYARGHVLRLAPPLCITGEEVDQLVGMVADSVEDLERDLLG